MALEDILLSGGLLSQEQIERARALSLSTARPLTSVLLEERLVPEDELLRAMARDQGLEFVILRDTTIPREAIACVPPKVAAHYQVMPVRYASGILTLAVSDPLDPAAVEDIQTHHGLPVERVLASRADIREALQTYYGVGADTVERILADTSDDDVELSTGDMAHDLEKQAADASVVHLVNQLFHDAIEVRATDIHFEIGRDRVTVRRRIDGILYDTSLAKNMRVLYPAIVSRIKLMSGLNIVERRLPQDGRSRVKIGKDQYDLRVSVVPSVHGEDIVVRILPSTMLFDLEHLGFSAAHQEQLASFISGPHGIVFVTGPTGSGKSTTLYACLSRLNTRERKIITIEDPVEYELKGITQTQINPGIGLTFSSSLRSMLRHDPDIMMVGEVRDPETAEIAIQTAMTGHLVLSTLHTNDAAGAAVRLMDMGMDPYLITSTVRVFLAQRLVRLICERCKTEEETGGEKTFRGAGCRACNNSGYQGRMAICEFLPLLPEIQQAILDRESAAAIRKRADALGMPTLADDGQDKVRSGLTTPEELLRVISM